MFSLLDMLAVIVSQSTFGAYICHKRFAGLRCDDWLLLLALKVNAHQEIGSAEDRTELAFAAEEGRAAAVQHQLLMLELDLQKRWQRVRIKNLTGTIN